MNIMAMRLSRPQLLARCRSTLRSDRYVSNLQHDPSRPPLVPSTSAERPDMRGAVLALFLLAATALGGCSEGVLDPKGPIASAERLLLINSTAIMLVVVLPVISTTLAFAWWYRSSNTRATRSASEDYEGRLEFVIWSIPVLIVILLGGVIWIGSHELDPRSPIAAKAAPLRVEVVALDWKWLFIYPDQGIAAVNELVIPAGTPVSFRITSATVMNSFFIPQLGSQVYAMGGMATQLNLLSDVPGAYPGFSAMYSGDGFSDMRFTAKAVHAADFEAWIKEVRDAGSALDEVGYGELAAPSSAVPPKTYGSVEANLFEHIIDRTISGAGQMGSGLACCRPIQRAGD
jgi:cytochrome o ubiquinol oxidase subunit 2